MKPCVYVLISQADHKRYIGSTDNIEKRYNQHSKGLVLSTKRRRPLILKYVQELDSLITARIMESKYKKSRGAYERAIKNGLLKPSGV